MQKSPSCFDVIAVGCILQVENGFNAASEDLLFQGNAKGNRDAPSPTETASEEAWLEHRGIWLVPTQPKHRLETLSVE